MTASASADLDTGQVVVRYRDRQAVVHYADADAARPRAPGAAPPGRGRVGGAALRRAPGRLRRHRRGPGRRRRPAAGRRSSGTSSAPSASTSPAPGRSSRPLGAGAARASRSPSSTPAWPTPTGPRTAARPTCRPSACARGYDFVANDRYPNDRSGHGTFVASAIAAAADNHFGMIGVAYRADIMPVRVLDSLDEGTSSAIARGIRYAVDHGAQVINLSVEFFDLLSGRPYTITSSPDVRDAIRYAGEHRVPVVVAAGQLRRGRDPLDGARRLDHLRRRHDRARLPGRLLELRPRRRRRRARAAAATPRCPTTPTARPTPRRGATSSRSASSTASTATSRSRTIAAGASG